MCFLFLLPFSQTVQWAKNWKKISTLVKNADADVTPLSNTSSYTLQLTSKLSSIWCQKSDFTRHQSSDSFGWLAGPGLGEQVFQLARPHRYPAAQVSALLPAVGFHRRLDPMGRPLACTDPTGRVLSFVLKLAVTMIWTYGDLVARGWDKFLKSRWEMQEIQDKGQLVGQMRVEIQTAEVAREVSKT